MQVWDWISIVGACVGMALMSGFFSNKSDVEFDHSLDRIGQFLAILGAVIVSFSHMLMRRIAGRMYLMLPPFYLSLTSNVLVMPFALWMYTQ